MLWLEILSGLLLIGFSRGASPQSSHVTADYEGYPWMVQVTILYGKWTESSPEPMLDDEMFSCAGTLVRPTVVLTAAHCVYQYRNAKRFSLLIRSMEYQDVEGAPEKYPRQERWAGKLLLPEKYDGGNDHRNNLALIILKKPFDDAPNVRPLRLREKNDRFDGTRCVTSGLAHTHRENGRVRRVFEKVDIPIVDRDECQRSLRKSQDQMLDESFICAGGKDGSKGPCLGVGGAAIACPLKDHPHRHVQVGIIGWAYGCQNFGVHPDVQAARDWIDKKIAENIV